MNSREASIVLDPQQFSNDVNRIMQEIDKDPLIAKRIISPEQAMALVTPQTLIVMVDVHRPSMTPAPEAFESVQKNSRLGSSQTWTRISQRLCFGLYGTLCVIHFGIDR